MCSGFNSFAEEAVKNVVQTPPSSTNISVDANTIGSNNVTPLST